MNNNEGTCRICYCLHFLGISYPRRHKKYPLFSTHQILWKKLLLLVVATKCYIETWKSGSKRGGLELGWKCSKSTMLYWNLFRIYSIILHWIVCIIFTEASSQGRLFRLGYRISYVGFICWARLYLFQGIIWMSSCLSFKPDYYLEKQL